MNCLLIETKDKRKFFTHQKNLFQLIEFSKAFNAEILVVKLEEGSILELDELAPAICDPTYKKTNVQYKIIGAPMTPVAETTTEINTRNRTDILKIAHKVKKYINEQFQNHNTVSLKDLKKKFKEYKLTDGALCNHIRRVKSELEKEGVKFLKLGAGQYKVS